MLDRLFASAHSDRAETFYETAKFSDVYGTTDLFVTNSDFTLDNPEKRAKSIWSEKMDFSSGIVALSTLKHSARKYQSADSKDFYHIATLPLEAFSRVFADGPAFAKRLLDSAKGLMRDWEEMNGAPEKVNKRTPVEISIPLNAFEWRVDGNKQYKSVVELRLSTFGFTMENMSYPQANNIRLRDIKVGVKQCLEPASPSSDNLLLPGAHQAALKHGRGQHRRQEQAVG